MAELEEGPASGGGFAGGGLADGGLAGRPIEAPTWSPNATLDVASDPIPNAIRDGVPDGADAPSSRPRAADTPLPFDRRVLAIPPIVIAAVFVMVGLIAFGLLTRPQPGMAPESGGPGGSSAPGASFLAPPPPIVGLSILSPTDGQAVAAPEVTVIGTAPPGVSITQDISLGLDQHATTDGTGHWAIKVGLNEGDNKLTFRIGDDRSTEKSIRVTYTPSRTP
jgi:hypothetical protein